MTSLLNTALLLAEAGIRVFPLKPMDKMPIVTNGVKEATTDENIIRAWWLKWPKANIGIAMGAASGVLGLDIDYHGDKTGKNKARTDFLQSLPPTITTITPGGGHHAFFKYNSKIKNGLKLEEGVTVRSDGFYFVAPPSIHPITKTEYKFLQNYNHKFSLWDGEVAELPDWILNFNEKEVENKKPFEPPKEVVQGERYTTFFKLASSLRSKGMEHHEIVAGLNALNERTSPPVNEEDINWITESVCKNYKSGKIPIIVPTGSLGGGGSVAQEKIMEETYPDQVVLKKGCVKKLGTIANLKEMLKRLGYIVRYNVISKKEEILIPGNIFTVDNEANASLACIVDWCERIGIPHANLKAYLTKIADENPYNPVATWIESREWDGVSRLQDFFNTILSQDKSLKETLIKRWLISCVAAVYEPNGISAHGVLVFVGAQNMGKTSWFKKLAPAELRVLKDGYSLRPDDRDSVFQAISNWLVELGELDATFRKADIAQLKAFLPKDSDILRRPFAQTESHYARRTIFFGSVNEKDFLKDPTGNRRFWTIECDGIDYAHNIDMQQLWSEVKELYKRGEPWILNKEEIALLNSNNASFLESNAIEEKIFWHYNWENASSWEWKTTSKVCSDIGMEHPTQRDYKSACNALRIKSPKKERFLHGARQFWVPVSLKSSVTFGD